MKKAVILVAAFCLIFALIGCDSTSGGGGSSGGSAAAPSERRVPGAFPDFVKQAIFNAPEDVLVGIGSAKMATLSQSRTISATRARAEISRQMNSMVQDMVRDYTAGSEMDPSATISFQENITVALSKADVSGARIVDQDADAQGNIWTVVWMDKAGVAKEISQAQAAAKLAVPQMASFNAEDRMNEAFARQYTQEAQVGNN